MTASVSIGGTISAHTFVNMKDGETKTLTELFAGGAAGPAGPAGEDGVGITNIAASQTGGVVTLTFSMSDGTDKVVTYPAV